MLLWIRSKYLHSMSGSFGTRPVLGRPKLGCPTCPFWRLSASPASRGEQDLQMNNITIESQIALEGPQSPLSHNLLLWAGLPPTNQTRLYRTHSTCCWVIPGCCPASTRASPCSPWTLSWDDFLVVILSVLYFTLSVLLLLVVLPYPHAEPEKQIIHLVYKDIQVVKESANMAPLDSEMLVYCGWVLLLYHSQPFFPKTPTNCSVTCPSW